MTKEFVPYELALKLKELGFEERCFTRYYESGKLADSLSYLHHNYFGQVNAPTFQQAFRWFREKYGLFGYVFDRERGNYYWGISKLFSGETEEDSSEGPFDDSYEEAELACLDKLIEIVELKQQEQ
jgi:hypothetical protein